MMFPYFMTVHLYIYLTKYIIISKREKNYREFDSGFKWMLLNRVTHATWWFNWINNSNFVNLIIIAKESFKVILESN